MLLSAFARLRFQTLLLSAIVPAVVFPHNQTLAQTAHGLSEERCANQDCRKNVRIFLKKPDGSTYEEKYPLFLPIVQGQGNIASVLPGEVVYLEAAIKGTDVVELKAVPEIRNTKKTLTLKLEQPKDIGDGSHTLLTITNPFPYTLRYHTRIVPLANGKLQRTSSCPIRPGLTNYEHWPYPIHQLFVERLHFIDEGSEDSHVCKE